MTPVLIYWVPISIHAPRVGSDLVYAAEGEDYDEFQSTLPVWGATVETVVDPEAIEFQSTLPVWGATGPLWQAVCCPQYFNPRSPCGERQQVCTKIYLRICNMRESCVHFRRWY